MITLKGVSFAYGAGAAVLDHVDFHLGAGLTLLLGPNGCGKSTLMKVMAGVESPDAGSVVICGRDLWREEAAARMPIAYLPEYPDLTPYASVLEILRLVCRLRGEPVERAGVKYRLKRCTFEEPFATARDSRFVRKRVWRQCAYLADGAAEKMGAVTSGF